MIEIINQILDLERESQTLWVNSFTNIAFSPLSEADKDKFVQMSYKATAMHSKAMEIAEAVLEKPKPQQLSRYPSAIAELQVKIHGYSLEISNLQDNIRLIEVEVDCEVAFDTNLTNESKRKIRRAEILDKHPQFWEYRVKLEGLKNQKEYTAIELGKLQGEFSVAKLEKREEIARFESGQI
jgi:hypothetical protein